MCTPKIDEKSDCAALPDTTATSNEWLIYYMVNNPDIQAKAWPFSSPLPHFQTSRHFDDVHTYGKCVNAPLYGYSEPKSDLEGWSLVLPVPGCAARRNRVLYLHVM